MTIIGELAQLLHYHDRHAESEPFMREYVDGAIRDIGVEHPVTTIMMLKLARILGHLGEHDEQREWLQRTYDARLNALGADHADTVKVAELLEAL